MSSSPHDSTISDYFDRVLGVPEFNDRELLHRRHAFGVNVAKELQSVGGASFLVEDRTGRPAIAVVGETGVALATLDEEKKISLRILGRLDDVVITSSRPADDGDLQTPSELAIEHPALPSGRITCAPRTVAELVAARTAFCEAFGP